MTRNWDGKPYHSLDFYLKQTFGGKVYKLALDGGMTCPNRDGTLDTRGCIFCSRGGSGEFSEPFSGPGGISAQIELAKLRIQKKLPKSGAGYIAYFQSYTNTYAPVSYLEQIFSEAIEHPDISILSVATRPDCLPDETAALLSRLNRRKPVWIELGLQTIHESTARTIRRGYELPVFEDALKRLKEAGLTVIVHVILGLPGETREQMLDTVRYLGGAGIDGIKLQLLHVLKGTDLEIIYRAGGFRVMSLSEYAALLADCISLLPPEIVIHRISGDGPKKLLAAPLWSGDKKRVLNTITKYFSDNEIYQGSKLSGGDQKASL